MTTPKDREGEASGGDAARDPDADAQAQDPVARRIQERRTEFGWSLAELAERAGLRAPSHIFHIEAGEKIPSEEVAVRLADALGEDREVFRAWARLRGRSDLRSALSAARTLDASLRHEAVRAIVEDPHHEVSLSGLDLPPDLLKVEWPPAAEGSAAFFAAREPYPETPLSRPAERDGPPDAADWWEESRDAELELGEPSLPSALRSGTGSPAPERRPRAEPAHPRIPLLAEGADPEGPEGRDCPAATLRFQRGVLEAHPKVAERLGQLEEPFAYLLTRESTSRTRGFLPPGYVAILTRATFPLEPKEAYAVRLRDQVEIGRVRWDGRRLLLLPSPEGADFAVLRAPSERAVARRLAGRIAILVPPEAVRAD